MDLFGNHIVGFPTRRLIYDVATFRLQKPVQQVVPQTLQVIKNLIAVDQVTRLFQYTNLGPVCGVNFFPQLVEKIPIGLKYTQFYQLKRLTL